MQTGCLTVLFLGCGTSPSHSTKVGNTSANNGESSHHSSDSGDSLDSGAAAENEACHSGVNPAPLGTKNCVRQAACQWNGVEADGQFGHTIHIGGDIDGDGQVDWVIGAPNEDTLTDDEVVVTDAGKVHIFRGANRMEVEPLVAHLVGASDATLLGYAAEIVPDLNGDGLDDVVAGGRGSNTNAHTGAGEVHILFGKTSGWEQPEQTPDLVWLGAQDLARAGSNLHGTGDMNGDGLGELTIATNQRRIDASGYERPGSGTVALFLGSEDFANVSGFGDAHASISGVDTSDAAGHALGSGDLNGDGYRDLIVGAPYGSTQKGHVAVFPGGLTPVNGAITLGDAPILFEGDGYGDAFGWSVAAGDINGDAHAELVIGAPKADDATPDSGTVHVLQGAANFFDAPGEVSHRITGEWDDHQLGASVLAGMDINGDGTGDLLLGAIGAWHGLITKGGRVYSLYGPSDSWPSSQSAATSTRQFLGASTKDYLGNAMATGDPNGDGKADIMLASSYAQANGRADAGAVYLFWAE